MQQRFELAWTEAENHHTDITSSIGHRLYNYKIVLTLIRERPLQGWGTGSYDRESCRLIVDPAQCAVFGWHPHDQYLFFWVENGLPGLLVYLWLIAAIVRVGRTRAGPERCLVYGLACALMADSLVNSPLFSARENHFFMFMMALLAAGPVLASEVHGAAAPASAADAPDRQFD
jgi:O-antigen ligase